MTKVIDTLTQEDFHGGLPEVFSESYNGYIAAGGDNFKDESTINKSAYTKKVWKLIS